MCLPFAYSDHHLIKLQVTFGPTNPRGRGVWLEFREKPTKYFYQLEKQRQTRNQINELCVGDRTVTSHKIILTACRDFYVNLYTAELVDLKCQDWLLNQLDTTLTSENQEKCEGACGVPGRSIYKNLFLL